MAKTKEELNTLKNEFETVTNKLKELKDDELEKVSGGDEFTRPIGTEEETDKIILENLTDNKGADE